MYVCLSVIALSNLCWDFNNWCDSGGWWYQLVNRTIPGNLTIWRHPWLSFGSGATLVVKFVTKSGHLWPLSQRLCVAKKHSSWILLMRKIGWKWWARVWQQKQYGTNSLTFKTDSYCFSPVCTNALWDRGSGLWPGWLLSIGSEPFEQRGPRLRGKK